MKINIRAMAKSWERTKNIFRLFLEKSTNKMLKKYFLISFCKLIMQLINQEVQYLGGGRYSLLSCFSVLGLCTHSSYPVTFSKSMSAATLTLSFSVIY